MLINLERNKNIIVFLNDIQFPQVLNPVKHTAGIFLQAFKFLTALGQFERFKVIFKTQ